jgi:hypothetical protein
MEDWNSTGVSASPARNNTYPGQAERASNTALGVFLISELAVASIAYATHNKEVLVIGTPVSAVAAAAVRSLIRL